MMLITMPFYSAIESSVTASTLIYTVGVLVMAALPLFYFWDRR